MTLYAKCNVAEISAIQRTLDQDRETAYEPYFLASTLYEYRSKAGIQNDVKMCRSAIPYASGSKASDIVQISVVIDASRMAAVFQVSNGQITLTLANVEFSEHVVRPRLRADSIITDANAGEELIVHAMALEADPEFKGAFRSGIDLMKIRSVKMYKILQSTQVGHPYLIDAADENGNKLGAFLGGLMIGTCK
ncbi:hypothetical protein NKH70_25220 [Mesorhizobium sp. M0991]|uniref:hypothetical protein n=1 Tax=Mesorhizobium sp. M0991 TaxID=2957043 RepID=UPI00333D7E5C